MSRGYTNVGVFYPREHKGLQGYGLSRHEGGCGNEENHLPVEHRLFYRLDGKMRGQFQSKKFGIQRHIIIHLLEIEGERSGYFLALNN